MALRYGSRPVISTLYRFLPTPGIRSATSHSHGSGELGSGAGRGGGAGGTVREAGGAFGKMEAAREEEYFKKLMTAQLHFLKKYSEEELKHHELLIKKHEEEINRHKKMIKDIRMKLKKEKEESN
ncbi:ATPase inhibitor mai-2, mitochondrial-like [Ornithodoros turicata]|uniref:ATPase inhibitor mai-2, mitochondrial-like n=1 Tax=Ornithodoros turicata TaxID=34597 RepID=UPI0031388262